jgi:hypothetical protein
MQEFGKAAMFGNDWEQDFQEDQSFLSSTLEIMIDKLHEYAAENDLTNAEIYAKMIRETHLG